MIGLSASLAAQAPVRGSLNTWFMNFTRLHLNEQWTLSNELHERNGSLTDWPGHILIRPSVDWRVHSQVELSVGYTFVRSWPYAPYTLPIPRNEHNVWEQVLLTGKIGRFKVLHRFRQEHRWVDHLEQVQGEFAVEGADYLNRFRYRMTMSTSLLPLRAGKEIFVNVFDEIWFSQDEWYRPTSLSRNWLYLGAGLRLNESANLQLGYMSQLDLGANGSRIGSPILQLSFFKDFSL